MWNKNLFIFVVFIFSIKMCLSLPTPVHTVAAEPDPSAAADDSTDEFDAYMESEANNRQTPNVQDTAGDSQTFYPSFFRDSPPHGHSRPYSFHPENAPFRGHSTRSDLLGSGDFGVIRGGTFYQDSDKDYSSGQQHDLYGSYYHNNGHGRPSYYFPGGGNYQEEQFANFRDFADINTPSDPAYSQFVVVYANRNSTNEEYKDKAAPKNIMESLAMLDQEIPMKKNKQSHGKIKLALLKQSKKYKIKKEDRALELKQDMYEPLLALS